MHEMYGLVSLNSLSVTFLNSGQHRVYEKMLQSTIDDTMHIEITDWIGGVGTEIRVYLECRRSTHARTTRFPAKRAVGVLNIA